MPTNQRIVSGMRPTGALHLGHYFGVLLNWVELTTKYDCYYFIADWHALTTNFAEAASTKQYVPELVMDWVAAGLSPENCVIFQQSLVKEHAELQLLLSMITPLGWLERNPTYKEVKQELEHKEISTHGFLGYPVLQAADILMYKPVGVPVGHDQLPHLELTREIARRFNHLYGELFPEPDALLTPQAKLPGLDGRKMSKSYGNTIMLKEAADELKTKVMSMLTDTNRMRLKDPGDPDVCNLFPYLAILDERFGTTDEPIDAIRVGCTDATRGCVACKKLLVERLAEFLEPIQARRRELERDPDMVWDIIRAGSDRAREFAVRTMDEVRAALGFNF
jgi:tryptophanyl-tRNA synthetase